MLIKNLKFKNSLKMFTISILINTNKIEIKGHLNADI